MLRRFRAIFARDGDANNKFGTIIDKNRKQSEAFLN